MPKAPLDNRQRLGKGGVIDQTGCGLKLLNLRMKLQDFKLCLSFHLIASSTYHLFLKHTYHAEFQRLFEDYSSLTIYYMLTTVEVH